MLHQSSSPEQTKQIATEFARTLNGGDVVFLVGDLGSGKTTFVQGLAEALNYSDPVRSPTFALMNIYPTQHAQIKKIIHVDLYRLNDDSELRALALEEFLDDPHALMVIEWPQRLESIIKKPHYEVKFDLKTDEERSITIEKIY